jgi:ATP-dependent Clp protease adaptor protein ClpS
MNGAVSTAVETPPVEEELPRQRPKRQPPYAVVLFNDDEHTFQYVVETLMKTFGYPVEKSCDLTMQVHNAGRGIVWSGCLEVAELKRDQLRSAGPDFYAMKKVDFPLGVTIEPLPG